MDIIVAAMAMTIEVSNIAVAATEELMAIVDAVITATKVGVAVSVAAVGGVDHE